MTRSAITSASSEAHLLEVVLADQADCIGMLNGASALYMMGKAALRCAAEHSGCSVKLAKADSIEFVRPIRIGSTVDIRARVVFQGLSTMTVIVEMTPDASDEQEDPSNIYGRFLMVAVDTNGIPISIASSTTHDQQKNL
ncbi:hotdog domain-containing protein [Rhodopseudomonas palustris]|uniref:Thioesterase superfamily n=1 Tax=Rhodopseudomonas palustris (strain BisB18) TaxID=316056 RepID=Q210X6_RHOPB